MKEFQTAVKTAEDRELGIEKWEFQVDGKTLTAYEPNPAQVAVVMSSMGRHSSMSTKIAGIIDFLMAVMDHEDAGYLAERLMDRDDDFGLPEVEGILSWLIEEWGGHPTQGQSGSSSSRSGTGPTSTRRTTKSTSGRSRSAGS